MEIKKKVEKIPPRELKCMLCDNEGVNIVTLFLPHDLKAKMALCEVCSEYDADVLWATQHEGGDINGK